MLPKLKLKPLPVIISPRPFHAIPFLSPFTQDSFFGLRLGGRHPALIGADHTLPPQFR